MTTRVLALIVFTLALSACASGGHYRPGYGTAPGGYAYCHNCGIVDRIDVFYGERRADGGGAVIGAIVGGVLGSQVGSGHGRDAATVAGAIAGGVAGHQIEKNARGAPRYDLFLTMDDGRRIVVTQRDLNGIREGARVRVSGNRARLDY